MYSVIGDFSKVDEVRYARYLANKMALGADKDRTYLRVPDGGTLYVLHAVSGKKLMDSQRSRLHATSSRGPTRLDADDRDLPRADGW